MESKKNQEIHVHCTYCSYKWLFDCTIPAEGIIKIKCPSCKSIVVFDLHHISLDRIRKRLKSYQQINSTTTYIQTEPRISMEI